MGDLLLYGLGSIVGTAMFLLRLPVSLLDGLLNQPGLSYVWGYFVWICSLFGDAGATVIAIFKLSVQLAIVYVPFFVFRKFAFRISKSGDAKVASS